MEIQDLWIALWRSASLGVLKPSTAAWVNINFSLIALKTLYTITVHTGRRGLVQDGLASVGYCKVLLQCCACSLLTPQNIAFEREHMVQLHANGPLSYLAKSLVVCIGPSVPHCFWRLGHSSIPPSLRSRPQLRRRRRPSASKKVDLGSIKMN